MRFFIRLLALVAGTALVAATLPSCVGSQQVTTTLSEPLDSAIQHQVARQLGARRVKIKGPVTIQVGTGNVNAPKARGPVATAGSQAQDYTRAGQHGGALATAPSASAGATTRTGVPPWALVVGVGLLLVLLVAALVYRYRKRLALLF